jgi:uncharacterized protein with von Willebrand factor type A (vWA) domain
MSPGLELAAPPDAAMPESLLLACQEGALGALDLLPRRLWLGSIIHSQGWLAPRLAGLHAIRLALLDGVMPPWSAMPWPAAALAAGLAEVFARLELPRLCRHQPESTDQLVSSMLWHLDLVPDYLDRGDGEAQAQQRALGEFGAEWAERSELIEELKSVFGDAEEILKNTHWDQLRGLLRSKNWQQVLRARGLIERLPELARLIRQLGRARVTMDPDDSNAELLTQMEPGLEPRAHVELVQVPELPGQTRGVYRSGRIARMLPAEMLLLRHPKLRLVWHARHAERALLSYEEDDRMRQSRPLPAPVLRPSQVPQPQRRLEAGPMLLCVDTSGSMQGGAEAVAKAVVLEAMRVAHAQKRACHLFAFGGPQEIVEIELGRDMDALRCLGEFMGQGFHGGTDICGPIERAIARLELQGWQSADLLIASDGEFGATRATAAALARAKSETGLRVQGVLVGDRETIGMKELADAIFWVRDWRQYGQAKFDSPLQSNKLTEMFFPAALRRPAAPQP